MKYYAWHTETGIHSLGEHADFEAADTIAPAGTHWIFDESDPLIRRYAMFDAMVSTLRKQMQIIDENKDVIKPSSTTESVDDVTNLASAILIEAQEMAADGIGPFGDVPHADAQTL